MAGFQQARRPQLGGPGKPRLTRPMYHINVILMKKATVRDLRYDFPKVEAWMAAGEEIVITKRGKPVARLVREKPAEWKKPLVLPDYRARRKRIWGDRVFSAEEVEEMRTFETGEP
jgi:antitoxin (DNA-binding transcriptional repressor) of toxin-antitoxin stability system